MIDESYFLAPMFQLAFSLASLVFFSDRGAHWALRFWTICWGVLVILISKYGIAVFSGPVGYGVLSKLFSRILHEFRAFPSL